MAKTTTALHLYGHGPMKEVTANNLLPLWLLLKKKLKDKDVITLYEEAKSPTGMLWSMVLSLLDRRTSKIEWDLAKGRAAMASEKLAVNSGPASRKRRREKEDDRTVKHGRTNEPENNKDQTSAPPSVTANRPPTLRDAVCIADPEVPEGSSSTLGQTNSKTTPVRIFDSNPLTRHPAACRTSETEPPGPPPSPATHTAWRHPAASFPPVPQPAAANPNVSQHSARHPAASLRSVTPAHFDQPSPSHARSSFGTTSHPAAKQPNGFRPTARRKSSDHQETSELAGFPSQALVYSGSVTPIFPRAKLSSSTPVTLGASESARFPSQALVYSVPVTPIFPRAKLSSPSPMPVTLGTVEAEYVGRHQPETQQGNDKDITDKISNAEGEGRRMEKESLITNGKGSANGTDQSKTMTSSRAWEALNVEEKEELYFKLEKAWMRAREDEQAKAASHSAFSTEEGPQKLDFSDCEQPTIGSPSPVHKYGSPAWHRALDGVQSGWRRTSGVGPIGEWGFGGDIIGYDQQNEPIFYFNPQRHGLGALLRAPEEQTKEKPVFNWEKDSSAGSSPFRSKIRYAPSEVEEEKQVYITEQSERGPVRRRATI